jgi:hypothetical protein
LSQRGLATILCVGTNIFVISGAGLFWYGISSFTSHKYE